MTPPEREEHETEEEKLIREGIEHRLEELRHLGERRRHSRRSDDHSGPAIRLADLSMLGAILAIVIPILGVAFYVRDIANQVTIVVLEQSRSAQRDDDHERRIKLLETRFEAFNQSGITRQEAILDHEQRLRRLEGRSP